jgi:hypothetical protein
VTQTPVLLQREKGPAMTDSELLDKLADPNVLTHLDFDPATGTWESRGITGRWALGLSAREAIERAARTALEQAKGAGDGTS